MRGERGGGVRGRDRTKRRVKERRKGGEKGRESGEDVRRGKSRTGGGWDTERKRRR